MRCEDTILEGGLLINARVVLAAMLSTLAVMLWPLAPASAGTNAVSSATQAASWVGLTEEQVTDALGKPNAKMQKGGNALWLYGQGDLTFRNGVVISEHMISREEWTKRKLKEREEQVDRERDRALAEEKEKQRLTTVAKEDAALPSASPTNKAVFKMEQVSVFDLDVGGNSLTFGQSTRLETTAVTGVKHLPNFNSTSPFYGSIRIGISATATNSGITYCFACDESAGTGRGFDRLYFDRNGNGDLSDDPPIALSPVKPQKDFYTPSWTTQDVFSLPFEISCGSDEGNKHPVEVIAHLMIGQKREGIMFLLPTKARVGKIKIDGKLFRATLGRQYVVHWRMDDASTALFLYDTAKNTSLSSWWGGDNLKATHRFGETHYQFSASPEGDQLTVSPYAGELGLFEISAGNRRIAGEMAMGGSLMSKETSVSVGPEDAGWGGRTTTTCKLPVGDYTPSQISVYYGKLSFDMSYNYHSESMPRGHGSETTYGLKIRKDKSYVWAFTNAPEVMFTSPKKDFRVKAGEKVDVSAVLVDPQLDIMIRGLHEISSNGALMSLDPKVTITRLNGESVAGGVMPFG